MKTCIIKERPFEYLRHKDTNEAFSEETVKNWYIARAFVLYKLNHIAFAPGSDRHLHVVVDGDSPLMLAAVRQLALSAHYPNFVEYDPFGNLVCKNRTIITLRSDKDEDSIVSDLQKEENLCNLMNYCRISVFGKTQNENSFIDIELEVGHEVSKETDVTHICEDDIKSFVASRAPEEVFTIDTRKAVYASRAYRLGAVIDNLPYEDIHSAGRYNLALNTFQYRVLQGKNGLQLVSPDWENNLTAIKNGLSNIFCSDCFESKELAIKQLCPDYEKLSDRERHALWEKNCFALSLSEHCRWVTEKLILGFRPLNVQERIVCEGLFGSKRSAFSKQLKNNAIDPAHIDLCSYRDLRRIDPDSLKYDSFLMLAIPLILKKIQEEDGK